MQKITPFLWFDDLKGFQTSRGTIRFSSDKPLPVTLVKKLVKARMAEAQARLARNPTSS